MKKQQPAGKIYIVDPSPLNWLFILFHAMEEMVRADREGYIEPSLASDYKWINDQTLEFYLREGIMFQNREPFTARTVFRSLTEESRWDAPHPVGTWANMEKGTQMEVIDDYTVRFIFPQPDGLARGKMRAIHLGNELFWNEIGFGYAKEGTGEGRW